MPLTDRTLPPLAERVVDRPAGPARLLTLATPIQDVVSVRGSFRSQPDFAAGEGLVQDLTVALLDKGTRHRDRFAIAELLDDRGAQLGFGSDGLRVGFHGRVLRQDLPVLVELLAEQLIDPLLEESEFVKVRERRAAALQQRMERTGPQAEAALARALYPPGHPNHDAAPEAELERLATFTPDDARRYHAGHFGARDLNLVFVGDLDHGEVEGLVQAAFGDWPAPSAEPPFPETADGAGGRTEMAMPGKPNLDVYFGHPLPVRRQDAAYVPLYVGNYVLGGNFSARLMTAVRGERGLTYGIRSGLAGLSTLHGGHWQVNVTLSRENLDAGIEATLAEVRRFVADGITPEELAEKQTTIAGSFSVGLATTGGLAAGLLANAERGFSVARFERFPAEVQAQTLEAVNAAIRTYFDPDRFHTAIAGDLG